MDDVEHPGTTVDDVVGRIREMVAERRRSGSYPDGWEARLDGREADLGAVRQALTALRDRSRFEAARIPTDSRLPGGSLVHRATGRVVGRQTQGILEQVQQFTEETVRALDSLLAAFEAHVTATHPDIAEQLAGDLARLNAIADRVARFERESHGPDADLVQLRRRVEELEAAEARRGFHPWFGNEQFERLFRGSREELLDRYRDLAEQLRECAPVLDIGFGRGEMLELLADLGVEARGVEIDPLLVERGRERGLDVAVGDAIGTLTSLEDGALGGIVLIQVVEHLAAQELLELVVLAVDKVRPGGRLVMETVNPRTLSVFANSFYLDPTHVKPIHPAYLEFLCRQAGFRDVGVMWRSFPGDEGRLAEVDGVPDVNCSIEKLNRLLFGPGDYAIVASR